MFRPASNCLIRASSLRSLSRTSAAASSRRFLSTAPPAQKSRSWKSSAARWGLAGAIVYYYNTSNVFADEPASLHLSPEAQHEAETALTLESIARRKQQRDATTLPVDAKVAEQTSIPGPVGGEGAAVPISPEELDQEAGQQGAYNEETGEINWDCPCLGGMAHGPCGPEFKEAFSCFVYSKEEPKGVDCIEKFKGMQDCFRQHPDIYGAELDDDEEEGEVPPEDLSPDDAPKTASPPRPPPAGPLPTPSDEKAGPGEMIVHVKPEHIPKESPSKPKSE